MVRALLIYYGEELMRCVVVAEFGQVAGAAVELPDGAEFAGCAGG